MAQEGPLTPEKQLLRLIEKPEAKGVGVQINKIKHQGVRLFSFGALAGRFSFFKESIGKWVKGGGGHYFDNRILNRILIVLISLALVYFISDVSFSLARLGKKPDISVELKKSAEPAGLPGTSLLKAAAFYLEQVRGRNIFEMGDTQPKEGEKTVQPSAEESLEASQSLKLVGIAWSDDPDAMIEDTKAMKTFFVKRGEMVGEFKVEAIFKNKVILTIGGEEIELR